MPVSLILMFNFRFTGDEAELGIIRGGQSMKVQVVLNPRVHLVRKSILWWGIISYTVYILIIYSSYIPEGSISH